MREKDRNSIEIEKMLPQFTTMNVIDGQAGLMSYSSLIFYSLTIDNILNIIVLLILAAVSIATLTGQNGILTRANDAAEETGRKTAEEKVAVEVLGSYGEDGNIDIGRLNENLKNVEGLTSGLPIDKLPATVVVDGYNVTINEDGSVTAGDENDNQPSTTGKTDGSYDTEEEVNTPKLKDNMKLVIYDNGNWVEDTTK